MIKRLIIISILSLVFSCDKKERKDRDSFFYIYVKGDQFVDSTKVYLKVQKFNTIVNLDTTYFLNNYVEFNGKITKPEVFGIYIDSFRESIGLFIENDSVYIELNKNNLTESKIRGSNLNDEYLFFISETNKIMSKTNYLFPLIQKARTENDVKKLNEIHKKINAIYKEKLDFTLQFAKQNPNSYVSALALQSLLKEESVHKDTIASIFNSLSNSVKKGDISLEIFMYLENENVLDY